MTTVELVLTVVFGTFGWLIAALFAWTLWRTGRAFGEGLIHVHDVFAMSLKANEYIDQKASERARTGRVAAPVATDGQPRTAKDLEEEAKNLGEKLADTIKRNREKMEVAAGRNMTDEQRRATGIAPPPPMPPDEPPPIAAQTGRLSDEHEINREAMRTRNPEIDYDIRDTER